MSEHCWIKEKMTELQKDLGFDLYKCINCDAPMNLSAYASQGMPEVHYEKCESIKLKQQ